MPVRLSRGSLSIQKPHTTKKKSQKRSLNAFAIASVQAPETTKIRQHRLGDAEDDGPKRKKMRLQGEDNNDEEPASNLRRPQQKKVAKGRFDELDISEGSDSEGNHWQLGHVDEEDDSDLDSDAAFGESDEEKFQGFAFRGSASNKPPKKIQARTQGEVGSIDLNESSVEEDQDEDKDDLGDDAIDLADALDESGSDEEDQDQERKNKQPRNTTDYNADDEVTQSASDEPSEYEMSEEEQDTKDPMKLLQLQDLVSSLRDENDEDNKAVSRIDANEHGVPSEYGLTPSQKLTVADLLPSVNDPHLRKSLKLLSQDGKPSKRSGMPGKLEAPLPKRQQDRLDRAAAYGKAKETLDRWIDTVKHNRRADHLFFPLKNPNAAEPNGAGQFLRMSDQKPQNELETAIHNILSESGLAAQGKDDEEAIQAQETLQLKQMPIEEVEARRAQLRLARDLLFREEVRAKRIKKIKSKAYRRVHRKERQRYNELERQALVDAGVDFSEEERERRHRLRAEERMGARHRESKWAKSMKQSGRAAWDEDARAGVQEMSRRNDELRQRMQGKDGPDDEAHSGSSSGEEDVDDEEAGGLRLQLDTVENKQEMVGEENGLASMRFMKRAETARKAQNDIAIEQIRRDLASEDGQEEEDEDEVKDVSGGRRMYGPQSSRPAVPDAKARTGNEFEERDATDEDTNIGDRDDVEFIINGTGSTQRSLKLPLKAKTPSQPIAEPAWDDREGDNPWLAGPERKSRGAARVGNGIGPLITIQQQDDPSKPNRSSKVVEHHKNPDIDGWTTVTYAKDDASDQSDNSENETKYQPFVLRNQDLVKKAFAGDDVVAEFEAEKAATTAIEDSKTIDNTLPGWGSWVGEGLSKRVLKQSKNRFTTTQMGVAPSQRRDKNMEKVIVSEKSNRKGKKYLASNLPHPFETKAQYERSLRLPIGPEWGTKMTFQDATKPRVIVKQGIIKPIAKPMM